MSEASFHKPSLCKGCPAYFDPCLTPLPGKWSGAGDDPAHIIVVGAAPSGFSVGNKRPFYGREGRLFKDLLSTIRQYQGGRYDKVKIYYTYAALVGAYEPKAGHLASCQVNLQRELNSIRGAAEKRNPIIVPLGPIASKAVGIHFRKISDIVGRELTITLPDSSPQGFRKLTVVPLLSMRHLLAKIGTANVMLSGLLRAVQLGMDPPVAKKSLDEVTKDYIFPNTLGEVEALVDHIINYYNPERGTGPQDWHITLDTETNTLKPYSHPNPKTLLLSCAWDDGKATAIVLDHPEATYKLEEVWPIIERLLRCPKPKTLHNWKFDQKFIEIRRALEQAREIAREHEVMAGKFDTGLMRRQLEHCKVNNVAWDTMLGEHYIDEDKKGHYRLKQLVPIYAPEYQGYDETLQNFLRGKEEDEEQSVEPEETSPDAVPDYPELVLNDDELEDFIVYVNLNGIDTGRPEEDWDQLSRNIEFRRAIEKTKPKDRTPEQKDQYTASGHAIKALRQKMNIVKSQRSQPKTKSKKIVTTADDGFQSVPLETLRKYAAADADVTRLILKAQTNRLNNTGLKVEADSVMSSLYLPCSRVLSKMEFHGFAVDQDYMPKLTKEVESRVIAAENAVKAKFDPTLNLNSPKQVSALMGRLNFESLGADDTGSTNKDTLEKYMEKYPETDARHQFCYQLVEFREAHKVLNTYLKPVRRHSKVDGRIHCGFNLNGTATGRTSSSKPNMQNIPKIAARRIKIGQKDPDGKEIVIHPGHNIKKLFVPANPDNLIVNVDIKGAEIRVYTAYSRDEEMIEALNKGIDTHSLVTSKVYGIPYDEVQAKKESDPGIAEKRTDCKKVFFSTLYGGGPRKISQIIGKPFDVAQQIQNDIFLALPQLRTYVDIVTKQIQNRLMVKTFFGRCRRFRMAHVNSQLMNEAIREGVNFLIQSTSSDLVLSQLCEVDDHIEEIQGELLITVHDSLTLEVPKSLVTLVENVGSDGKKTYTETQGHLHRFFDKWIVQRVAEKFAWLPVPFLYDIEAGPSYGEMKGLKRPKKEPVNG